MRGFIMYYQLDEETKYPGGWSLLEDNDDVATRRSFELSNETLEWALRQGETISGTKVEFEIKCHCYVSEDEKMVHHRIKGHVKNI